MKKIFKRLISIVTLISLLFVFLNSNISLTDRLNRYLANKNYKLITNNWSTDKVIAKYKDPHTNEVKKESISINNITKINRKFSITKEEKILLEYNGSNFFNSENNTPLVMEYVQPDFLRGVSDNNFKTTTNSTISWGAKRTGANILADIFNAKDGKVIVAVIDSGADLKHDFLKDRLINGYDYVDDDDAPQDKNGHGTHVTGIIVDSTPSNVKVMPIRVLNEYGFGYDFDIVKGILYAVDNGADIINLSLGGVGYSEYFDIAIDYALANDVLVVAAAGNDNIHTDNIFPAQKKEIIVVSATTGLDDIASFSNYGDSIDICAPGEDIYSSTIDNEFAIMDGTSMATPYVSAIASMIKLHNPKTNIKEIEAILKTYTDDLGNSGWDQLFGEGLVNVSNFVNNNTTFSLISPTTSVNCWNNFHVKYYTKDYIGATLNFYLDDVKIHSKKVTKDGFQNELLDLKKYDGGKYDFKIELITMDNHIESKNISINYLKYNTLIQVLDIYNNPVEKPHILFYGINNGTSRNIKVDSNIDSNGVFYTNLDLDNLLKDYDKIIAVTSGEAFSTNLNVPIYIRNIVSNGIKVLQPKSLQKVLFKDDFSVSDSGHNYNISISPFVDDSTMKLEFPVGKRIFKSPRDKNTLYEFWVDQGNHKLSFSGPEYNYILSLNGVGETTLNTNKDAMAHLSLIGEQNSENFNETNYGEISFQKYDDIISYLGGRYLTNNTLNYYLPSGNYKMSYHRNDNDNIINFYKYVDIDNINQTFAFNFGGKLTDKFILDYTNTNLDLIASINDSYGNITNLNFWIPGEKSPDSISGRVVLENIKTNEKFIPEHKYNYYQRKERERNEKFGTTYTFLNREIPDGKYNLYLEFDKSFPIYETDFHERIISIKDGRFVLDEPNTPPTLEKTLSNKTVKRYEKLEMDLNNYFKDPEEDTIYYKSSEGYIFNDKLHIYNSLPGIKDIEITATDFKGGKTTHRFKIIVLSGNIIIDNDINNIPIKNIENASDWAVDEILDAMRNGLVNNDSLINLQESITRKDFCNLVVKFYEVATGKESLPADNNPFKDTDNIDVLKAYNLGAISGKSADIFAPNSYLTREEMCVIIRRILQAINSEYIKYPSSDLNFKDTNKISSWAKQDVLFCNYNGILNGTGNNMINPKGSLSREVAIVLLNRTYNKFMK